MEDRPTYTQLLEQKIEQYEEELGKIQIYKDYADQIIDIAVDGYENAKMSLKNCKQFQGANRARFRGEMDAYEKMLTLIKKWMRELE